MTEFDCEECETYWQAYAQFCPVRDGSPLMTLEEERAALGCAWDDLC